MASFLQLFVWERFGRLFPVPVVLKFAKPQKVIDDGVEKEKTSHLKPRGLRCFGVTWPEEARKLLRIKRKN